MAYTSAQFGASNEYTVFYPTGVLYAFSPYYLEVETASAGQDVTIVANSFTMLRVSNSSKLARFPISAILQSYFVGVEFGDVLPKDTGVYNNTGSKLIKENKDFVITVGTDTGHTKTLTFDIIWGALQQGESEKTTDEVYVYDNGTNYLPMTITANMGDLFGKDVWISNIMDDGAITTYELKTGSTVNKTYTVVELPYCAGGHYLRWISPDGEYRYFYFLPGTINDEITDGAELKQTVWSLEASAQNQIKSETAIKNKTGKPYYEATVLNATYNQQIHLFGLQRAIKTWVWENNLWIETRVSVDGLQIDRFRKPKEINVKITKPNLYIQSL